MAARHHLYKMSCLRQALVLQRMLIKHGIVTELRFGVSKESADTLEAHAWLEYEGQAIGESQNWPARFTSLTPQETHR